MADRRDSQSRLRLLKLRMSRGWEEKKRRAEDVQEEDLPGSDWPPAAVTALHIKKGCRKKIRIEELKLKIEIVCREKKQERIHSSLIS